MFEDNYNLKGAAFAHLGKGQTFLSQISPKDERWDVLRKQNDQLSKLYRGTVFDRYADRIDGCSSFLKFGVTVDSQTGESSLRLESSHFCRVPRCPVCQWRKSMTWRAKAFNVLPKILEAYPTARFIFLTLTVRNCHVSELRSILKHMNSAWQRLSQRNQFPAVGWLKAVEVTRVWDCYDGSNFVGRHGSTWVEKWEADNLGKKLRLVSTDECHPHFHCLLMVKPSYFTGAYYLSHEKWTELWQKSLRVEYTPVLDVRTVKSLPGANEGIFTAVLETLKYSVKPSDVLRSPNAGSGISDQDWLVEITAQMHNTKSIATGGVFKEYLSQLEGDAEDESEDLIHTGLSTEDEIISKSASLFFVWNEWMRRYSLSDKA